MGESPKVPPLRPKAADVDGLRDVSPPDPPDVSRARNLACWERDWPGVVANEEAFRDAAAVMDGGLEDFAQAAAAPGGAGEATLLTQEDGPGGPARGGDAGVIGGHLLWTSAGEANAMDFLDQRRADNNRSMNRYMDELATRTRAAFARMEADAARREQGQS